VGPIARVVRVRRVAKIGRFVPSKVVLTVSDTQVGEIAAVLIPSAEKHHSEICDDTLEH
jgi:hypothetical protein